MQQSRTVQVRQLSDLATEREIHEFFSFSGEIERVEIPQRREAGQLRTAFVTFKDAKALEIALLLSIRNIASSSDHVGLDWEAFFSLISSDDGATIVDHIVTITLVENYIPYSELQEVRTEENAVSAIPSESNASNLEGKPNSPSNSRVYVSRAQDVVSTVLAKGSAIKQDAVNKAKAFDEKHRLTATASAKVMSFDQRVGLTEKLTVGISVVNEKVKSVDQKLHVSDKTMAAIFAAERKINDTGSAVKTSRYVTASTAWFNGAFSKMSKAGQAARSKTREKFHIAVSNLTAKDSPIVA